MATRGETRTSTRASTRTSSRRWRSSSAAATARAELAAASEAAAAELAREFHAFHKLPMLDSFDIHRPRSDFPADMGGHYIVPVRDEGSSEVRALVGPVGDAYVHVLLGALCAEDKS